MSRDRSDTERRSDLKTAVQQTAGQLVLAHLTKIIIGLGALLVLVWNLRGDLEERERRLEALTSTVERITIEQAATAARVERLRDKFRELRRANK